MKSFPVSFLIILATLISHSVQAETYKCEGGIYTDSPANYKSCVGITSKKPYEKPTPTQPSVTTQLKSTNTNAPASALYEVMLIMCMSKHDVVSTASYRANIEGERYRENYDDKYHKNCYQAHHEFATKFQEETLLSPNKYKSVSCDILQILDERLVKADKEYEKTAYSLQRIRFARRCNGENTNNLYIFNDDAP